MSDLPRDRWLVPALILFVLILALAFLLPPLLADQSEGLAAAGTAAVTFLFCLLLATVVAGALVLRTVLRWVVTPMRGRVLGLLPALIVAVCILGSAFYLSNQLSRAASDTPAEPTPTTAPAP